MESNQDRRFLKTVPLYPIKRGMLWNTASRGLLCFGGLVARLWALRLARTRIVNHNIYKEAIYSRKSGVPVITISNHRSVIDDWLLWPIVSSYWEVLNDRMRWVLAAEDVMFWSKLVAYVSALVRIVPCRRGYGVYQRGVDECVRLLNEGEWVHVYPEGKIIHTEDEVVRLKWGIGRLVADSEVVPLVVPVWHVGMDDFVPNRRPYRPYFGKRLTVIFGQPINFQPLVAELKERCADALAMRKQITDVIQGEFRELQQQALAEHHSWS